MFHARQQRVRRGEIGSLKTTHASRRDGRAEKRVFARAFANAAPARVARDVHHWRESPVQSGGGGFGGGNAIGTFNQGRIPRGGRAETDGKNGLVAVNHVVTEQQRNVQARLFDGDFLKFFNLRDGNQVEHIPAIALADLFQQRPLGLFLHRSGDATVAGEESQLPNLFCDRHPCQ